MLSSFRRASGAAVLLLLAGSFLAGIVQSDATAAGDPGDGLLTRGATNPILRNNSSYDDLKTGPTGIVKFGAGDYRMWYEALDAENAPGAGDVLSQTAYATSTNGTSWTKRGVVFTPLASPSWENSEACPTSIHWDGTKWILFYHGGNNTQTRAIGRATSTTGTGGFVRDANNPILRAGAAGAWDSRFVADAKVISPWEGPDALWRMYYVGRNSAGKGQVGLATSTNGVSFTKVASNPVVRLGASGAWDDGDIQAFTVEWDPAIGLFRGWYVARNAANTSGAAGYVWSANGESWTRGPRNPVLTNVSGDNVTDSIDSYFDIDRYRIVYGQYDLGGNPALRGKGEARTATATPPPPPPPPPPSVTTATFGVSSSADDGDVERGASVYPPPSTASTYASTADQTMMLRRSRTASGYTPVRVGLLRFDTSALPDDAVVKSAELRLHVTSNATTNGRSLVAEWYPASAWPIDGGDFTVTDSGSAHAGTPLTSIPTGQQSLFALGNLGSISLTGATALRLHVSGAGVAPTGANDLAFAAFDHATLPEPALVVRYERSSTTTTAIPLGVSADDGDVERGGSSYPPPTSSATDMTTTAPSGIVRRSATPFGYYPVRVGLLRFNTSVLPDDAIIMSADLTLHVIGIASTNGRSLTAEWYAGSAWPVDNGDWSGTDASSAHAGTTLASIPTGQQRSFALGNLGSISLTGTTGLRLHISGSAATPTGPNDFTFAAYDHGSLPEPTLFVTYRRPT